MHVLIVGMTLSGKTTYAKALCREFLAAGAGVLVLDPLNDPEWCPDRNQYAEKFRQTTDPDRFLKWYWNSRRCMSFFDEAAYSVGRFDKDMQRTATQGRHWGHVNYYLVQRYIGVDPTIRGQCTRMILFRSPPGDIKLISEEWCQAGLVDLPPLAQGQYHVVERYGAVRTNRLPFPTRK